jgi:hypothetical protein
MVPAKVPPSTEGGQWCLNAASIMDSENSMYMARFNGILMRFNRILIRFNDISMGINGIYNQLDMF